MSLRPGLDSFWTSTLWRVGALAMWAYKLRRTNGPNFTWPIVMFSSALPERALARIGKIYVGKPLKLKNRKELIASLRPNFWQYLRSDNGDLPEAYIPARPAWGHPRTGAAVLAGRNS
jgi:hypothetical protein